MYRNMQNNVKTENMNGIDKKDDCSSKYKLIYFDVRGRGEIPRLLFHAGGVPFTDDRVPADENWYKVVKAKMPQGCLPVLEVDGKRLSQSLTICRFLAREFGLIGQTKWEQVRVEEIVDTMDDLRAEVAKWIYAKEQEQKEEIEAHLRSEIYPKFVRILKRVLRENEENNNRSGYFVGDKLTLADLSVYETFTFPLETHPGILDDHLELLDHRNRIETHEKLADYIRNRPVRPV